MPTAHMRSIVHAGVNRKQGLPLGTVALCAAAFGLLVSPVAASAQQVASDVVRISDCGIGGGTNLSPRAAATFALSVRNDSLYINGIILGRAQPGWKGFSGTRQQLVQPLRAGAPKYLTGATIDTLFLQFDTRSRTAWIHNLRVPMDSNNVVLVDRLDTRGGPPRVVGLMRVASPVPFKGNCDTKDFVEIVANTISRILRSVPAIAAFMGLPPVEQEP
ncbi:MAG TPA: hypothetical protein VGD02_00760 [Gemmatimonadaceae bacterium]